MEANVKRPEALRLVEQVLDTLEWQVGKGDSTVDFLYPKVKRILYLLEQDLDEDGYNSESTTKDNLDRYIHKQLSLGFTDDNEGEDEGY